MSAQALMRAKHRAVPAEEWPTADRRAWEVAQRRPDFLQEAGRAAAWRPVSLKAARGAYARWLGWLVANGINLDDDRPAMRMTPERMRAYVLHLQTEHAPVTVASYLGLMCMAARALFPMHDWTWLQALQRRLRRQGSPMRNKAAHMEPIDKLWQLGLDLMDRAVVTLNDDKVTGADSRSLLAAARDYRDGLLISLLASRPLRVKNLLAVEIGRQLRPSSNGMTMHFPGEETKNHRPLTLTWPTFLMPALTRYREQVRPLLIAGVVNRNLAWPPRPLGAALFVAQGGTPLTAAGLRKGLARHTKARFGHPITAHLFRDCLASTLANADPDHARYAAHMLGHTGLRSTERSYIAADPRIALKRHHELLASMRQRARERRRAKEMGDR